MRVPLFFILCILIPLTFSSSLNFCSHPLVFRVIGGETTTTSDYPWQAVFFYYGNEGYGTLCGASILNEKWLLTAAHCVLNATSRAYVNVGIKSLSVAKKTLKIDSIYIHPRFSLTTVHNDIALVKVKGSIALGGDVQPVCIYKDDSSLIHNSHTALVTGFGMSASISMNTLVVKQTPSDRLLETRLPLVDIDECRNTWKVISGGSVSISRDTQLCAGSLMHGTGPGDSGGPLHVEDSFGRLVQVGITSFGANGVRGLVDQASYPGVYTRVSPYVPWIESVINSSSSTISLSFLSPLLFAYLRSQ